MLLHFLTITRINKSIRIGIWPVATLGYAVEDDGESYGVDML